MNQPSMHSKAPLGVGALYNPVSSEIGAADSSASNALTDPPPYSPDFAESANSPTEPRLSSSPNRVLRSLRSHQQRTSRKRFQLPPRNR